RNSANASLHGPPFSRRTGLEGRLGEGRTRRGRRRRGLSLRAVAGCLGRIGARGAAGDRQLPVLRRPADGFTQAGLETAEIPPYVSAVNSARLWRRRHEKRSES